MQIGQSCLRILHLNLGFLFLGHTVLFKENNNDNKKKKNIIDISQIEPIDSPKMMLPLQWQKPDNEVVNTTIINTSHVEVRKQTYVRTFCST